MKLSGRMREFCLETYNAEEDTDLICKQNSFLIQHQAIKSCPVRLCNGAPMRDKISNALANGSGTITSQLYLRTTSYSAIMSRLQYTLTYVFFTLSLTIPKVMKLYKMNKKS